MSGPICFDQLNPTKSFRPDWSKASQAPACCQALAPISTCQRRTERTDQALSQVARMQRCGPFAIGPGEFVQAAARGPAVVPGPRVGRCTARPATAPPVTPGARALLPTQALPTSAAWVASSCREARRSAASGRRPRSRWRCHLPFVKPRSCSGSASIWIRGL